MPDIITTLVPPAQITTALQTPQPITTALTAGQGPSGPAGPPGEPGVVVVAGATINGHRAIATNDSGLAVHADAATPAHGLATLGITDAAALGGASITVRTGGLLEFGGWAWTPGPVLLGLDGALVQTLPPSATFSLVLGYGSGQSLNINPQPAVTLQS